MERVVFLLIQFFIYVGRTTILIIITPVRAAQFVIRHVQVNLPKKRKRKLKLKFPKLLKIAEYTPFVFKTKYFVLGIFVSIVFISVIQMYGFIKSLPSPKSIGKVNFASSTHIFDRKGRLLFEIYRDQNRTPVKLTDIPPYVYYATIVFEDEGFFKHNGVSFFGGIIRAARETFIKKDLQGGSTITQQLVKNALLTPERTLTRKIKEAILALWTERLYTKKEILEMYFNQVPYGGSSYGIEEAAKTYFGKQAKDLKLEEAALLATLPQAPSLYSPYTNPQVVIKRRNSVLNKMKELGYIDEAQKKRAEEAELNVIPPKTNIRAPHFVFFIKSYLESLYGIQEVEEGGLRVTTTLDLDIQEELEEILKEEIDKIRNLNVSNGAILVTKPQTGEILAMVGSYDYFAEPSGAFNATTAFRQPGSMPKPLLYSLALERDYTAASIIDDTPITFRLSEVESYSPVNYDNRFHGRVPLRFALANSYNVPAVKVLNSLGVNEYIRHAKKLGVTTWTDPTRYGLSLALGGGEVKMTDMATAFGVFANSGSKVTATGISKIEDARGRIIYDNTAKQNPVLDQGIAFIISDILSDNDARRAAFGSRSALEIPNHKVAVKTGTTNDKKDNWTVGYTPELLAVVWVGNNDGRPMHPTLTSGITGAAPIWNRTMEYVIKKYGDKNTWFEKPADVIEKDCGGRREYFLVGREAPCTPFVFKTITPTPRPN